MNSSRVIRRLWPVCLGVGVWHASAILPAQAQAQQAVTTVEGSHTVAPPIAVGLEFMAPEGCSSAQSFESGLRARFARIHVDQAGAPVFQLKVHVMVQGDLVRGELRIEDASGESELRAVSGSDCSGVVAALSLTAALAIEQTTALAEPQQPGKNGPPSGAASPSPADGSAQPSKNPSAKDPGSLSGPRAGSSGSQSRRDAGASRFKLGAFVWVSPLVVPQTSVGLSLSGRVRFHAPWGLAPEFGLSAQWVPVDFLQSKGALAVSYRGLEGLVCPARLRLPANVSVSPCVTLQLGRLTASSRDVDLSTPSRRTQFAFGGDVRPSWSPGGGLLLEGYVGLRVPTARREYVTLDPIAPMGHTPTVGWALGLGALYAW